MEVEGQLGGCSVAWSLRWSWLTLGGVGQRQRTKWMRLPDARRETTRGTLVRGRGRGGGKESMGVTIQEAADSGSRTGPGRESGARVWTG